MDWLGPLIAILIASFMLFQLWPLVRARGARGRPVPELDALLSDAQRRAPQLLVYFWSPRCGMCRNMTPVIDRLAQETGQVIKINTAESPVVARHFGVMATPSLAVVQQGVIRVLLVGARGEPQIRSLLTD